MKTTCVIIVSLTYEGATKMPSRKPRVNLTVDDDMNEILADLAVLTGEPKSTFIMNVLREMKPALVDIRDALQNANKSRAELDKYLFKMVGRANKTTANINAEMAQMLEGRDSD